MVSETPKADFRSVEARIRRAEKFRNEMGVLRKTQGASHFKVVRERCGSTVDLVAVCEISPEFGIIFGDWLANIRASLDYLFFQLAVEDTKKYPPTRQGSRMFPIKRTREDFNALRKSDVLHGLQERTVNAIESMQPYHTKYGSDGNALLWLHDLARVDRHREPFKVGNLIKDFRAEVHSTAVSSVISFETIDPLEVSAVVGEGEPLVLASIHFSSAAAAEKFQGANEAWIQNDLEIIDWYRKTHTGGISANIRNDSLEERMNFVEYYLGLVMAHFKDTHGKVE